MAAVFFVLLVLVLVALFSVQNAMPVAISFMHWQFNASLAIIALLFFVAGMFSGMGVLFWVRMRRKAKARRAEAGRQPDQKASSVSRN